MSRLEEVHQAAVKAEQERLDREAIEHLDWDHKPVCQTYRKNTSTGKFWTCDQHASWRMWCRGCGFLVFVCDQHRTELINRTEMQTCGRCYQHALTYTGWAFEPLASA